MEYSASEVEEFERVFQIFDIDRVGSITVKDIDIVMRSLGRHATEKELQSMINAVDMEGNGFIDFNEFMQVMTMRMSTEPDEDDLREAFRIFDKDNSGYIGVDQLRNVFMDLDQLVTDEECEEMIRNYDGDADGKLSYEDFVAMMTTK